MESWIQILVWKYLFHHLFLAVLAFCKKWVSATWKWARWFSSKFVGAEMNSSVNLGFRRIQVRVNIGLTVLNILPWTPLPLFKWMALVFIEFEWTSEWTFVYFVSHLCILEDGLGTGWIFISQWRLHFLRVDCSGRSLMPECIPACSQWKFDPEMLT